MNLSRFPEHLPPTGRKRRLRLLPILLALLGLTLGGLWMLGEKSAPTLESRATGGPKEKAPDFILKDLEGQQFRLSDHREKRPVLIIFSTTWCTFCESEIPHFKSLHAKYGQQGLEIVNIDIRESQTKVASFAAQHQLPYQILLDEDATVSRIYEILGVPSLVLVGKDGIIVCRQCQNVEALVEEALKE
ncbi:MAG: TlpA family protein disulfide reductase [Syntrophaceae bacterium]|nr:TlpA family protein disulfide reductase [Syntrophaceae bacterium]